MIIIVVVDFFAAVSATRRARRLSPPQMAVGIAERVIFHMLTQARWISVAFRAAGQLTGVGFRVIVGTLVLGTIRTIAERFQTTAILTAVRALAGMRTLMDF